MESKKIAFSFSKTKKKTTLGPQRLETKEKVDYITSFDGTSANVAEVKNDLVIPMKNNHSLTEIIISRKRRAVETSNESDTTSTTDNQNISLEKLAIQELLTDSKKVAEQNGSNLYIPLNATSEVTDDDDFNYSDVPVTEFGYAMLRGMGWAPGKGVGKKQEVVEVKVPKMRAGGLGLGADAPEQNQK